MKTNSILISKLRVVLSGTANHLCARKNSDNLLVLNLAEEMQLTMQIDINTDIF